MEALAAVRGVAQQNFVGGAFFRTNAEQPLDGAFRQVDDLLDALQELWRFALIGEPFVALARNEVRGIAFGQENEIGIKRTVIGTNTDDTAVVANQAFNRGVVQKRNPVAERELGDVMVVDRPQDGVTVA